MPAAPSRIWSVRLPMGRQSETTPHIVVGRKSGQCRLSALQSLTGRGAEQSAQLTGTNRSSGAFPVPNELFGLRAGSYYSGMSVSRTQLARPVPSIVTRVPKSGQLSVTGSPSPLPHKRLLLAHTG